MIIFYCSVNYGSQDCEVFSSTQYLELPGYFLFNLDISYGIKINLKDEASRLGFTTSSISQLVYSGFSGYSVSTLYEGDNPIDVVLRLSDIYPKNNTYIGASLKWNLQDVLSNRTVQKQRTLIMKQAEENLANTKEQISRDIAKAYRKLKQSEELINVAAKDVDYCRADLKIQTDKRTSGLNLEADLLSAKASMAKAESDYYAAQMNYRIALSELKILTGNY